MPGQSPPREASISADKAFADTEALGTCHAFWSAVTATLLFGLVAVLAEWLAVAIVRLEPGSPQLVVVLVAMAAPVVLAASLLGGGVMAAWRPLLSRSPSAWLQTPGLKSSAAVITTAAGVSLWGGMSWFGTLMLTGRIRTPAYAAAADVLVAFGAAAVTVALLGPIFAGVQAALRRIPISARSRVTPGAALAAMAVTGLVCVFTAFFVWWDRLALLPWHFAAPPLLAGLVVFVLRPWRYDRRMLRTAAIALASGWLTAFVVTAVAPAGVDDTINRTVDRTGYAPVAFQVWSPLADVDGDGATWIFAGGDCAPFNAAVGPFVTEVPENGIDEDCTGTDLPAIDGVVEVGPQQSEGLAGLRDKPNIILVTTDALTFEHTGIGGYERDVTPQLDAWAGRATIFENAFSLGPATHIAFPVLFGGVYNSMIPMKHEITTASYPSRLLGETPMMAEYLAEQGYETAALVDGPFLSPEEWPGLTAGFDSVELPTDGGHTSEWLTDKAIARIRAERDGPLFLWVHYYDHHEPYIVPDDAPRFGDLDIDRYDSELAHADEHWGRLLSAIEARWAPEEHLTIFSADHGEAFDLNHPGGGHNSSLLTPEVKVPLIIQAPAGRGRRVAGLASHLDVLPTLGDILDLQPHPAFPWQGETLVPGIAEGRPPARDILFGLNYIRGIRDRGRSPFLAISARTEDLHYMRYLSSGSESLVAWREDELERDDLRDRLPERHEWFRFLANRKLDELRRLEADLYD